MENKDDFKQKLKLITVQNSKDSLYEKLTTQGQLEMQKFSIALPTECCAKRSYEAICDRIELEDKHCKLTIIKDQTDFEELTKKKMNDKFQKILIASVTHEIRTPLNIQTGLIETLADPQHKQSNEELIDIAKSNLKLLTYFVNDIPDLSKFDVKEYSLNIMSFSLFGVLAECEKLLIYQIQSKGLELKFNIPSDFTEFIETDKDRYRRIALNLLLNATKYTFQGSITCNLQRRDDNMLVTTITDTGIGISQEAIQHLFKLNVGAKDVDNSINPQGIGIGLTMCKKIAMALGGDIEIQSEVNVGSSVKFWIKDYSSLSNEDRKQTDTSHIMLKMSSELIDKSHRKSMLNLLETLPCDKTQCHCPEFLIVDDEPLNIMVIQNYIKSYNKAGDEV
jgi:K+-sensing histidine kinase KdpD